MLNVNEMDYKLKEPDKKRVILMVGGFNMFKLEVHAVTLKNI